MDKDKIDTITVINREDISNKAINRIKDSSQIIVTNPMDVRSKTYPQEMLIIATLGITKVVEDLQADRK